MTVVDPDKGFYYDLETGAVTQGRMHGWMRRMGPYATREDAEHALAKARERTEEQDEIDDAERQAEAMWPGDAEVT